LALRNKAHHITSHVESLAGRRVQVRAMAELQAVRARKADATPKKQADHIAYLEKKREDLCRAQAAALAAAQDHNLILSWGAGQ
jgi:hypothetical protein